MKKNSGLLTTLALVLAFFGVSSLPKDSSRGTTTAQTSEGTSSSARKSASRAAAPYTPCEEIQQRLQSIVADPQQTWNLPNFCYADPHPANAQKLKAQGVDFVIATAPNPIATHLPLLFDRVVEIIQQAAQDNNYSYDSAWLPWNQEKEYVRLPDQLAAQNSQSFQENQPGVIVFRKQPSKSTDHYYKGGLVVLVVSETPTGGINQEQFDNAVAWIQQLGGPSQDQPLKILGPTFSGSLPSLYRSLHSPRLDFFRGKSNIRVSSGTVSSNTYYDWFQKQLEAEKLGSFATAMEGDTLHTERFCKYINLQNYATEHVAVLSEDETVFGGGTEERLKDSSKQICTESGAPTYLYYPRDIATLRSAYEQQSIFSSAKQSSNANSAGTTLRGDLSEPANSEHDTVRSYGGQLTPLAQESVLLAITDILKEKKIEFVLLRSTNSLDQIFLTQFLRRSFPETRIVIDGSDLLFRRGAEGTSLRGVMVLSNYPLLTWQQDWTSPHLSRNGESYRIFGEDAAEGLYIAARGLFDNQGPGAPVANYAPPSWARSAKNDDDDNRPATWLTVIGHHQFWPVAVLDAHTLSSAKTASIMTTSPSPNNPSNTSQPEPSPMQHLPAEFWLLCIFCIACAFLHLLFCLRGSISPVPSPFRLAYFAPVPRWQHPALVAVGSVLIAALAVVLAATSGLLTWDLDRWNEVVAVLVGAIILCAVLAGTGNYRLPAMTETTLSDHDAMMTRRLAAATSVAALALFIFIHWEFTRHLTPANLIPAYWRSIHLLSGVSPLLPQLFLIAGMYCWFWFAIRGVALFGDDRPLLPEQSDLKLPDGTPILPMFSRGQAGTPTEVMALPVGSFYLRSFVMIFPIVALISSVVLRGLWLRTLGERSFGIYIFVWLIVCMSMVLADMAQTWSTWRRLRVLLVYLDRLPLRRTMNALQGLSWRSVWAMSGNVLAERYCLISRQIEALRHLANQVDEWVPNNLPDAKNQVELLNRIHDFQKTKITTVMKWYEALNDNSISSVRPLRELQEEIASIAAFAMRTILIPAWQTETESLIFDRSRAKNSESGNIGGPSISPNIALHVLAAEEFFVLPYLGFIQNILGRIRTIVLGSLFLFVASTLAVSSYPFDPLPVLGGIFLAVFVTTGTTMILIYAGMHRDATLSYITGTRAGELGVEFWRQLFTFGAGPLFGLLTTLFPSITDFVASWLQPSSQAIK